MSAIANLWRSLAESVIKATGLWRVDVAAWNREAARLEKLSAQCAAAGIPDGAAGFQECAERLRRDADLRTAWATGKEQR